MGTEQADLKWPGWLSVTWSGRTRVVAAAVAALGDGRRDGQHAEPGQQPPCASNNGCD
jgi:hypothetical protein